MGRQLQTCVWVVTVLSLVACGSAPVKGPAENSDVAAQDSLALAASTNTVPAAAGVSNADATISAHIQKAIAELHVGRVASAKAELAAVIQRDPGNIEARGLLAQIQTDPARYFGGSESFSYTIQPGDTLMSIAQRFLDEPHKFYILARFNGVNDPSRLTAGRTIRVPGQSDVAESNVATAANAAVDSRVRRARHFHDAGKYQQAIDLLEGSATGNSDERDLLVLSYEKYAGELQRQRNFDGARTLLEKALAIRPANEGLRAQLRNVEKQREIDAHYQAAMDAIAAGDNPKALDSFNAVLKLDPAHEEANKQIARLRTDAAESIHRDALVEYNKQNLDKAIDLWGHVLALLPTHQNAKLYRARAIDLRSRLQRLQTN